MKNKSERIFIRLTPEQKRAASELAESQEFTISEWVRQQIRMAAKQTQAAA